METGIDFYLLTDTAEKVLEPLMMRPQVIDNISLVLGYAGVYSSFLLHTYQAAEKFKVGYRNVPVELGGRKTVGGQEDWIIEVCAEMAGWARGRQDKMKGETEPGKAVGIQSTRNLRNVG